MFEPTQTADTQRCRITVNEEEVDVIAGVSLAAALLAVPDSANTMTASLRSENSGFRPWCMMGACYGCLVQIDGCQVQACMVDVYEGMQVTVAGTPA